MADVVVEIDGERLYEAIQDADGTAPLLEQYAQSVTARANALAAGYRTGRFYDRSEGVLKGDTQAEYKTNTKKMGRSQVALVYTANYAAQKENMEHNTLLKSI